MELLKNQQTVLDVIKDNGPIKKELIVELTKLPYHKVQNILNEFYNGDLVSISVDGMVAVKPKVAAFRNENSEHEVNHWREYKLKNLSRIV